ncbi:MAG TPA: hypothetical protein EYQ64_11040 [Gemmatimonadetes bacterium]|nr:hypothetical protein [Gemmatimonadota bacterium]
MAFFDWLNGLFGGGQDGQSAGQDSQSAGQDGPLGGPAPSESVGPQGGAVELITCQEASARLFEYLDGELDGISEEEVRGHLEVCQACYPRVEFEKHFLDALRRSQNGGRASENLKERVLRSLAEDTGRD